MEGSRKRTVMTLENADNTNAHMTKQPVSNKLFIGSTLSRATCHKGSFTLERVHTRPEVRIVLVSSYCTRFIRYIYLVFLALTFFGPRALTLSGVASRMLFTLSTSPAMQASWRSNLPCSRDEQRQLEIETGNQGGTVSTWFYRYFVALPPTQPPSNPGTSGIAIAGCRGNECDYAYRLASAAGIQSFPSCLVDFDNARKTRFLAVHRRGNTGVGLASIVSRGIVLGMHDIWGTLDVTTWYAGGVCAELYAASCTGFRFPHTPHSPDSWVQISLRAICFVRKVTALASSVFESAGG